MAGNLCVNLLVHFNTFTHLVTTYCNVITNFLFTLVILCVYIFYSIFLLLIVYFTKVSSLSICICITQYFIFTSNWITLKALILKNNIISISTCSFFNEKYSRSQHKQYVFGNTKRSIQLCYLFRCYALRLASKPHKMTCCVHVASVTTDMWCKHWHFVSVTFVNICTTLT